MTNERDPIIEQAAAKFGGIVAMSLALGRSRAAASQWTQIPPEHVLEIERVTGISRHRQRPDIFGPPVDGSASAVASEVAPPAANSNGNGASHGNGADGDGADHDGEMDALPPVSDRRRTTIEGRGRDIIEAFHADDGEVLVERKLSPKAVAAIAEIADMPSQSPKAVIPLTMAETRGSRMPRVRKAGEV